MWTPVLIRSPPAWRRSLRSYFSELSRWLRWHQLVACRPIQMSMCVTQTLLPGRPQRHRVSQAAHAMVMRPRPARCWGQELSVCSNLRSNAVQRESWPRNGPVQGFVCELHVQPVVGMVLLRHRTSIMNSVFVSYVATQSKRHWQPHVLQQLRGRS